MADQMSRLQDQVNKLLEDVNTLRQDTQRLAPLQDRILPLPSNTASPSPSVSITHYPSVRPPQRFRGPTSNAFHVDVARNTLHSLGLQPEDGGAAVEDSPRPSPQMQQALAATPSTAKSPATGSSPAYQGQPVPRDPLWDYSRDEMLRLCAVHEDEIGIMYPVLNMESVAAHARFLSAFMESAKKSGMVGASGPLHGEPDGIHDRKTLELKIVMAIGHVVEEHGLSERGRILFESVRHIAERKLMDDPAELAWLPFLALVAGYRFLSNDEVRAWRIMGQLARLCLELGLHRREGLAAIADEAKRKQALTAFWTSYMLDRRWSFGTGLPYTVSDDLVDPNLPFPDEYPYLVAMISYSRLAANIWKLVDFFEPAITREVKAADYEALDRKCLEWYETVPEEIKVRGSMEQQELPQPSTGTYNLGRLQIWTRLRLNQVRIWLIRETAPSTTNQSTPSRSASGYISPSYTPPVPSMPTWPSPSAPWTSPRKPSASWRA